MNRKLNLIFDLDGTLIDSSRGVVESVNYAMESVSLPSQPAEQIKRYIGCPLSEMFSAFTDYPPEPLIEHFRQKSESVVVQAAEPLPGVDETLKVLHQAGHTMGIATTKIRSQLDGILKRLGWTDLFLAVSGGDEVAEVKPAPDIFRLTMERMSVQPERTIVIGDTRNDVLGARAAGLPVIAIPSDCGDPGSLEASNPDHLIKQFDKLPFILEEIDN